MIPTLAYFIRHLDADGSVLPRVLGDDPRRLTLHLFYDKSVFVQPTIEDSVP